jgi:hypothetical protein
MEMGGFKLIPRVSTRLRGNQQVSESAGGCGLWTFEVFCPGGVMKDVAFFVWRRVVMFNP